MSYSKWRTLKKDLKKSRKTPIATMTLEEKRLLQRIRILTRENNRNNVTRTMAYFHYYEKHPGLHWALLAHLVSRNAGWNMTDLKGEYLPNILTKNEENDFFIFLERGNWLIFQDAYPQLLLYEESLKAEQPLFHLLDGLNVSKFMLPFWERYWEQKDSKELTQALIVNEQNYIEGRVVHNPRYMRSVIDKLVFKAQDILSMNHILFPYSTTGEPAVIGGTVHHFSDVHDRVLLGRSLYELLYDNESRLEQIKRWCTLQTHTGSRKDYWPHLFHDEYMDKSPKIYSPKLEQAWKDCVHTAPEKEDWFNNFRMLRAMKKKVKKFSGDIEPVYNRTLEEIKVASQTKETLFKH